MIITRLIGGLGNQLFQYAAARHLSEIHRTTLKLDISGFETYKLHKYSLGHFNIQENFATLEEITALTVRRQGIVERVLNRILHRPPKPAPTYVQEKHFHFDPEIPNLPDSVYLDGYWQSEKYFKEIEEIIRREFVVRYPLEGKNLEISEMIKSANSVSIHVRRGDYVTNPETSRVHGVCSLEYYLKSIKEISKKVTDPHFFIFSDDMEWVKENLKIDYPITYMDINGPDNAYDDMRLMSLCRHNIIANSSFSWWGAWLSSYKDKIVIAPRKWFQDENINTDDLIPAKWTRL